MNVPNVVHYFMLGVIKESIFSQYYQKLIHSNP